MSFGIRRGILTAAGHPVHPFRRSGADESAPASPDAVPIVERYQDLAASMHRTAVAPREDRFILGCVCGWAMMTTTGISSAKASLMCQQHVIDEAEALFTKLEVPQE